MEKFRLKVQIGMAALFNIGLFQLHSICFPVFNCHSCPISVFACPLGVIGQFSGVGLIPLSVIGVVALGGLIAGRLLCGWACPFGLFQDLLYKIPYVKFQIPSWTRFIKYVVFLGTGGCCSIFSQHIISAVFLPALPCCHHRIRNPLGNHKWDYRCLITVDPDNYFIRHNHHGHGT